MNDDLAPFADLTTPHVADACMRLGLPVRCAPAELRPVVAGTRLLGRVRPARHSGSVDVFLEALTIATPGEVLVVDNGGRRDEACVGDLVALEVQGAGLAGILIWGLHRDTDELRRIGLPVFSTGSIATGPAVAEPHPADALERARVGDHEVAAGDFVLADDDGAILLPLEHAAAIAEQAAAIRATERSQAAAMAAGTSFREQSRFGDYLIARAAHGTTFRAHLRAIGSAIEE